MNKLVKFLVESVLNEESTEDVEVIIPGGFKPPHGGHLELAKRYAQMPNVTMVRILVGPKLRDGISREQSLMIWNLLIGNNPKIKAEKAVDDNPLREAYKFIETAKPGTYALGASSKGDDYVRVKKFVEQHQPNGKYYREGINVIDLPIETKPLLYKNRTDGNDGGISASTLRKDIAQKDYNNFITNYPGQNSNTVKKIYQILTQTTNEVISLNEGGAAGHMSHPYEDVDLTFSDISNLITAALSGKLESAQEKLDGQNLMITYKDGKVRAARNKGHIKNGAANSITLKQLDSMFAGRGSIYTAFVEAMNDLQTAINRLSKEQKESFFNNGRSFLNLEVLYPATANVIPYGATQLRLHNITTYDDNGNVVSTDAEKAKVLQAALNKVEASNQKTYEIRITDPVTINKSSEYKNQKNELLKLIKDIMSNYKLKAENTIGDYVQGWWKDYIKKQADLYNYSIPDNVLNALVNRWGLLNKGLNIKAIRDAINNEEFKTWVSQFDQREYQEKRKDCIRPIELLFLKLGVYTLRNLSQLVALNPEDSVRSMKKDLKQSIEKIKELARSGSEDGDAALQFLKRELSRLNDVGGFDAILPTEGIVFKYNGKLYKLTGSFAPLNMILGYLKY